jgi:hypothetical protein
MSSSYWDRRIFGALRAIQRVIHSVESGTPHLFITAADLRPAAAVATPGSAEEPGIDARLDIYGALQIEGREQ